MVHRRSGFESGLNAESNHTRTQSLYPQSPSNWPQPHPYHRHWRPGTLDRRWGCLCRRNRPEKEAQVVAAAGAVAEEREEGVSEDIGHCRGQSQGQDHRVSPD